MCNKWTVRTFWTINETAARERAKITTYSCYAIHPPKPNRQHIKSPTNECGGRFMCLQAPPLKAVRPTPRCTDTMRIVNGGVRPTTSLSTLALTAHRRVLPKFNCTLTATLDVDNWPACTDTATPDADHWPAGDLQART